MTISHPIMNQVFLQSPVPIIWNSVDNNTADIDISTINIDTETITCKKATNYDISIEITSSNQSQPPK